MGSGWPTIFENTLMLHQQGLQIAPYFVKWQLAKIEEGKTCKIFGGK